jgi:transcriptional regulator with XRE-family HTH domain
MDDSPAKTMLRAHELFDQSGMTLDELGQRMGYSGASARHSAWQFLNRTADPRLSMLCRFARAVGVSLPELFAKKKKGRAK